MSDSPKYPGTGIPPQQAQHFVTVSPTLSRPNLQEAATPRKEKIDLWFLDPLKSMEGDWAFVCLMVSFPLLETVVRLEFRIPDEDVLNIRGHENALKWFAKFMTIPVKEASDVWDSLRNGLLHRAMIKSALPYTLTGKRKGQPAELKDGVLIIYVWDFRDAVVDLVETRHTKLWRGESSPLAKIHIRT